MAAKRSRILCGLLALVAQLGCCSWCEKRCCPKTAAPQVCQPVVCAPTTAYSGAPVAVPYSAPVSYAPPYQNPYPQQQQSWANPTNPQVLVRNPTNGCYCPQ